MGMKTADGLEDLARLARTAPLPASDVAAGVWRKIRLREATDLTPLAWFTAGSGAAAGFALMAARPLLQWIDSWYYWTRPLCGFLGM